MFYPEESLQRGGRFYLCWVADSWPLRFALITRRQLLSTDIIKLCNDLLEVVTNESGRPANRFSLRLSSQLMRGIVRLYEKKVTVFMVDLCMVHANVFKYTNKKLTAHEVVARAERPRALPAVVEVEREKENEQRVEELLQNSGNVVTNIQDITLKEAAIPDFQLPKNDGFGEEQPDQPLQLFAELGERSVEQVLAPRDVTASRDVTESRDVTAPHSSALGLLDLTDKSHDKSKLVIHQHAMETMQEHDISLFRKSAGDGLWSTSAYEKDIPEIPEIPPPEPTAPKELQPEKQLEQPELPPQEKQPEVQPQPVEEIQAQRPEPPAETERVPQDIQLQELEEPQAKRRRPKKLIVDKKTMLSGNYLRARIGNPNVELRCTDSSDDVIAIFTPWELLRLRPAHGGSRTHCKVGDTLTRIFMKNLHPLDRADDGLRMDMQVEEAVGQEPTRRVTRASLAQIAEVEEPQEQNLVEPQTMAAPELQITSPQQRESIMPMDITAPSLDPETLLMEKDTSGQKEQAVDIYDLPTQKLDTLSQAQKRTSAVDTSVPKRPRLSGYQSFRESQSERQRESVPEKQIEEQPQPQAMEVEDLDKENVPPSSQTQPPPRDKIRHVSAMLQEAGLTEVQPQTEVVIPELESQITRRKDDSETSETPLGSLDRTKVSLGESAESTETQKLIRKHWGIEGTMVKIMYNIKAGVTPLTVRRLVTAGPTVIGYTRLIAAKCFTSILKLKQHGFITVEKDEDTGEITDIHLGPRFDGL